MKILLAAALTLVLLAAGEGGLRLKRGAPAPEPLPDNFDYAHVEPTRPFFSSEKTASGTLYRTRRPGASPGEFSMPKPAGTFRVFLVGGSVALPFGFPFMQEAKAPWRRVLPSRRVELIACGVPGFDSRRDITTLKEALKYQPDLLVVMSGNNEYHSLEISRPDLFLANRFLRRSWLWRLGQDAWHRAPRRAPTSEDVERRFAENLGVMAGLAKRAKVPLMLCTLPANLRDMAPAQAMAGRKQPAWEDAEFAGGWKAWLDGDARRARARWESYARANPRDAYGAYFLARALDKLGDVSQARRYYRLAADLTPPPDVRCNPARNEGIRAVAKDKGVLLADLEKLFEGLARDGIPGLDVLHDPCHWHSEYCPLVMTEIFKAAPAVNAALDAAWLKSAMGGLRRPELAAPRLDLYALNDIRGAVMRVLGENGDGLDEYALSQLEGAWRLSPKIWEQALGSPRSLAPFLDPINAASPLAGSLDAHEARWPAVWNSVGEVYRRRGQKAKADVFFDEARKLLVRR